MAYGPDAPDQYRQEGRLVGKILKGANPADLPVERPTKLYFLVDLQDGQTLRPHAAAVIAPSGGRGD